MKVKLLLLLAILFIAASPIFAQAERNMLACIAICRWRSVSFG